MWSRAPVTAKEKVENMFYSLGNYITIKSILARYEPSVVRLFLLSQHYRTPVTYTEESLQVIEVGWDRLKTAARNLKLLLNWAPVGEVPTDVPVELEMRKETRRLLSQTEESLARFHAGMDDDLHTAQAIAALYDLAAQINSYKDFLRDVKLVNPTVKGALIAARAAFDRIMEVLGLMAPPEGPRNGKPGVRQTGGPVDRQTAYVARLTRLRRRRCGAGSDQQPRRVVEDHPQGTIWRREVRAKS